MSNQNNEIIKQLISWNIKALQEEYKENFIHDVSVALPYFKKANYLNIDLETKIPTITRRGGTSIQGRTCTFFTECFDELDRRMNSKVRIMLREGLGAPRGIHPKHLKEFINIIELKLGL
jgi:hypothetical protein